MHSLSLPAKIYPPIPAPLTPTLPVIIIMCIYMYINYMHKTRQRYCLIPHSSLHALGVGSSRSNPSLKPLRRHLLELARSRAVPTLGRQRAAQAGSQVREEGLGVEAGGLGRQPDRLGRDEGLARDQV